MATTGTRGDTRELVLDAALASFGTAGYDGTSLDDLAAGLGIRKQTILYHFVSKRRLLDSVVDRCAGELVTALERVLVESRTCLLYTSPSPRDKRQSRMPSSA